MLQCQIPIANGLPVQIVLLQNGTLVFVKVASFNTVIDQPEKEGVTALFDKEGFSLTEETTEDFFYNTIYEYKLIPKMLNWLQQQKLEQPQVRFI